MQLTQAVLGVTIDTRDAKLKLSELNTSFYRLFQAVSTASVTAFTAAKSRLIDLADSIAVALNKFQGFQSMMVAVNGDMKAARAEFDFLRQIAEQLGVRIDSLELNYSKLRVALKGVTDGADIAKNVFTGVSMAARTMHSSAEDTRLMFYAVTQMASKGVISMEELRRQLGEKLPGVMDIAARAIGTTTQKLEEMVRTGKMQSIPFLRAFGPALIEAFKTSAEAAGGTLDAALARFQNLWTNFIVVLNDSGAAQAMAKTVDAMRAKLSDTAVFEAFAAMIKRMADNFTDWINSLTKEDIAKVIDGIAKGFTAFTEAATSTASILVKLVGHVKELVVMLVALRGAQLGAQIGGKSPLTAVIGGLVGGALSGYVASEGLDFLFNRNVEQIKAVTAAGVQARQAELEVAAQTAKIDQQARSLAGGIIAEQFGFEKSGLTQQLAKISQDKVNSLGRLLNQYKGESLLKKKQDLEKQAIAILYDRPIIPDVSNELMGGAGKDKEKLADKATKAIQQAKEAAFAADEATTELEKMQLKVSEGGAYQKFDDATKKQLLYWAQLKDLIKEAEIEREQYAKTEEHALKVQYAESVRLAELAKQLTTKADPHKEYLGRLTDLKKMSDLGLIDVDQVDLLSTQARNEYNKDTKAGKADKVVRDLREEVEVLRLSNEEREIRKNLFDLEASGIERASEEWYKYVNQIKELSAEKVKLEAIERASADLGQTFTSMFEDALIKGKEFRDVLKGVAQDLMVIATRELVSKNLYAGAKMLFGAILKGMTGGSGADSLMGDFVDVNANVGHSGGVVGSLNQRRAVDPLLFMNARRFHNGLMADEYPAILQRGERIVPRSGSVGGSIVINAPVSITDPNTGEASTETAKALSVLVQSAIKQEIIKQTRPGGVLYG